MDHLLTRLINVSEAQQRIGSLIQPLPAVIVPLGEALGRIAAEESVSSIDLPIFDNSAMDGYAVRTSDVASASPLHPVMLRLTGQVAAGSIFQGSVESGQCVRVFTGSPIPRGADSVIMQEDTRIDSTDAQAIEFLDNAIPGENIRAQGLDIKRGASLIKAGDRITVGRICLLAAAGIKDVCVGQRPVIGLLATGSELQEGGKPLGPGQIYECNRTALAALLTRAGIIPRVYPLLPDTLEATQTALARAFEECDGVVTSGGVSVGDLDWVKTAFQQLGGTLEFWRVSMKPGKPFALGQWKGKTLFGLPGNPVSALVTFQLLVRPALARWQGAVDLALPSSQGILAEALVNDADRPHFVRVCMDSGGHVKSAGFQAAHALGSLAASNALVEVPPESSLLAGSNVQVIRWESD